MDVKCRRQSDYYLCTDTKKYISNKDTSANCVQIISMGAHKYEDSHLIVVEAS